MESDVKRTEKTLRGCPESRACSQAERKKSSFGIQAGELQSRCKLCAFIETILCLVTFCITGSSWKAVHHLWRLIAQCILQYFSVVYCRLHCIWCNDMALFQQCWDKSIYISDISEWCYVHHPRLSKQNKTHLDLGPPTQDLRLWPWQTVHRLKWVPRMMMGETHFVMHVHWSQGLGILVQPLYFNSTQPQDLSRLYHFNHALFRGKK